MIVQLPSEAMTRRASTNVTTGPEWVTISR
jgi:hypothetical protein